MRKSGLLLAMLLLLPACVGERYRAQARNPDLIERRELADLQGLSALEAIHRLRPAWLSRRTPPGPVAAAAGNQQLPHVFIDGSKQSEFDVLESLSAADVEEIRFMDGQEATTRFGTGYTNGAILVSTRTGD